MPEPITSPPVSLSKRAIFFRRLSSFVVLWTVVIGALFSGHKALSDYVFLLIILVLAVSGLMEFYGMAQRLHYACYTKFGLCGGVLLILFTFVCISGQFEPSVRPVTPSRMNDRETIFLILFVLGLCVRQFMSRRVATGIIAISTTLFGLMYVPWLLNFIQKINFFGQAEVEGKYYVLYFVLVTKFSDCGAYAVGSLIGRHKMIPRISPGKTWEGFGGAVVVSTGASVLFARLAGSHLAGMTTVHSILLGIILSLAAVVGDLIESLFKREAGLKDSGHFFPGIGGILDLLDSLLFNAPIMYLYLRHVLT